jgi:hypothetical protein
MSRQDNTEGYPDSQLKKLIDEFEERLASGEWDYFHEHKRREQAMIVFSAEVAGRRPLQTK